MPRIPLLTLLPLVLALAQGAVPARAVIIDSGDGTGNTSAPPDDPGWDNVGIVNGSTGIYLGDRAVLTANHVGASDIALGGTIYTFVPGSAVQIGGADLLLFEIYPDPGLPPLEIAASTPLLGTPVTLIGRGRNRGSATTFNCNTGPGPPDNRDGYFWGSGRTLRWGTNHVDGPIQPWSGTLGFTTRFHPGATAHEAQAADGDSGGAVFAKYGPDWDLVGLMFLRTICPAQPSSTALEGNDTVVVDLASYRDEILDAIAMPEPGGALLPGAAVVALLARRRRP